MTDPAASPQRPNWKFKYFFDSGGNTTVDRYDHEAGQGDEVCMVLCGRGKVMPGEACTVINAADGVFVQWGDPTSSGSQCCDCTPILKKVFPGLNNLAVKSNWVAENGGKYVGQSSVQPGGEKVDEWVVEGLVGANHYLTTTDSVQQFKRFWEVKKGKGLKQWDVLNFSPDRPKASLFQPPIGCTQSCAN